MALMWIFSVKDLLAGFFNDAVELESTFPILASGITISNRSFSAVTL
jgi:hypothetical protein